MNKKKKLICSIGLVFGLLVAGGSAQAVWETIDLEVGAFNGKSQTSILGKSKLSNSKLRVDTVGGDYKVDWRLQVYENGVSGVKNYAWEQNIGDKYEASWWSDIDGGERLQFSNKLTTPVKVSVDGWWDTSWLQ